MPTYHACGVTARLTTCDLKPTISSFMDLRMGGEQRKDAARIQKNLSSGKKLDERPIGLDGSEKGVVQFIGAHEDLPLFMVEAGERLKQKQMSTVQALRTEQSHSSDLQDPGTSPLTSLGATPTPTHEAFMDTTQAQRTGPTKPQAKSKPQSKSKSKSKPPSSSQPRPSIEHHTLEQALQHAGTMYTSGDQALVLDIQMEHESFLPTRGGSGSLGKDLKIEVFLNGELADVSFINARRSAVQIIGDKIRFTGTRVHRQTEKPWIYTPEDVPAQDGDTEKRWCAVSKALEDQARCRGTDKYGDLQPSAEFLAALAAIQLPERLRRCASIGVVDVVITAGKGQKHGPETVYLTGPTRLDDPDFTVSNPAVDPLLLSPQHPMPLFDGGAVLSPLKALNFTDGPPLESSPDVPLKSRVRVQTVSASPSPTKNAVNIAREFGFDLTQDEAKALTLGAFETSRGKAGPEGRSLFQRLGDLKKMNERNRTRELEKLKEEFSAFVKEGGSSASTTEKKARPRKRTRTDSDANYIDPSKTTSELDPQLMAIDQKMQDDDVFGASSFADPKAVLTQNRIDMALDSGAASSGALLRRIASTSPVKTPRKTKAAALAYSPTRVPIKEQTKSGGKARTTPQKPPPSFPNMTPSFSLSNPGNSFSRTPNDRAKNDNTVSPTKSGRGANRSATKWDPKETSFAEALEAFDVPRLCKGSRVTYAGDKQASRQIGKARGGMFKEEALVVGMRFCVW